MLASAVLLMVALAGEAPAGALPADAAPVPPAATPPADAALVPPATPPIDAAPKPPATPRADEAPAPRVSPADRGMYADKRIAFRVMRQEDGLDFLFPTHLQNVPTMGTPSKPLVGAQFYEVVGRDDLASAYRARNGRRIVLMVSGLAFAFGGVVYAITAPSPDPNSGAAEFSRQIRAQDRAEHIALGITAGGLVLFGVGAFTNPNPVDEAEMRRLAEQYNGRLTTPGLSVERDLHDGGTERPRISFGAVPTSRGASAAVAVAF